MEVVTEWTFNKRANDRFIQEYVSITDFTITYKRFSFLPSQEIKLKNSVMGYIPLINKYVVAKKLEEERLAPYGMHNYIGNTDQVIQDVIEFIRMLGDLPTNIDTLKTYRLTYENTRLIEENKKLREENEEFRKMKYKTD
jgi:hypothetical protein